MPCSFITSSRSEVLLYVLPTIGLKTQTMLTACTCSCCEASARSFLRTGHNAVICTPLFAIAQASSCPAECNDLQEATAKALHNAALGDEESAVDYSRFCLQSCSPPGAKQSLCTPSLPLPLLDTSLLAKPESTAPETGTLVAEAEGKKASAMAAEAKVAAAEAAAAAAEAKAAANLEMAQSRGSLASEITEELKASAARAAMYANSASESVKKAEKELQEMKDLPKKAAEEAAQEAIRQLQQEDDTNKKVLETFQAHATPTLQPPSAAAAIAASPFRAAIREAEQVQNVYEQRASQLKSEADLLRASSASVGDRLDAYANNKDFSRVIRAQSHDLLVESLRKETEAAKAMDDAHRAGRPIPKLEAAAATAAARASIFGT